MVGTKLHPLHIILCQRYKIEVAHANIRFSFVIKKVLLFPLEDAFPAR